LVQLLTVHDRVVATFNRTPPPVGDPSIEWFHVDVTDQQSVASLYDALRPSAKRITLVNLAGLSINRLAVELPVDDWSAVIDVSLKGSFLMSKTFLRPMIRERWGRIINVTSIVAAVGVPGTAAYATANAGLVGLTRTLSKECAPFNVTVNCLSLGYFHEGLTNTLSEDQKESVLKGIPLRRFGKVEELAGAIRFLVDASYTTGSCVSLEGGLP
jgi:3-oxoacyl-[acyl-carrier protein] reductase